MAQAFADLGASVVVNSASSVAAGQQVADDLPDAIYVQADVSDPAQAERLVDAAVEQYGRLDIVVNNAGTTVVIPHHDLDAATNEIWERILRVNVLGAWNVIRAAAPHLRASGDGVVLNITSSPASVPSVRPSRTRSPRPRSTTSRCCSPTPSVPRSASTPWPPVSSTPNGQRAGTTSAPRSGRRPRCAAAARRTTSRTPASRWSTLATRPGRCWSSMVG